MRPPRPAGFGFLCACSLIAAVAMALLLSEEPLDVTPAARLAMACTGALALVTAEALAYVRRWAFGASLAFAGVFPVMTMLVSGSVIGSVGMWGPGAVFAVFALAVVHEGLESVYGTGRAVRYGRAP